MRLKPLHAVRIYGSLWFIAGVILMRKGLPLIAKISCKDQRRPLIDFLKKITGTPQQAAMLLVVIGLAIGFLKGKTVLASSAKKAILRLEGFPERLPLRQLFSVRYCLLLGLMVCFGVILRILHLPHDVHGLIDLSIGSALLNGALVYFRK